MVDRVLVTGGAGFIGSHLVDGLMSEGFDVAVLDDLSNGRHENLGLHLVKPVYAEPRAGDVRRSCADLSKAEGMLGYKPKTSLREGLTILLGNEWGIHENSDG